MISKTCQCLRNHTMVYADGYKCSVRSGEANVGLLHLSNRYLVEFLEWAFYFYQKYSNRIIAKLFSPGRKFHIDFSEMTGRNLVTAKGMSECFIPSCSQQIF